MMGKLGMVIVLLLVLVFVIAAIGCGGKETKPTLTPTPTPSDLRTFSKYGFSFQYHKSLSVTEKGMYESEATERSGILQVGKEEEDLFSVAWQEMVPSTAEVLGLGMTIEAFHMGFEMAEEVRIERGEQVETTHGGHPVLYEDFVATIGGDKVNGIVGALYCDKSLKSFGVTRMSTTIGSKEDLLEDFMTYLDSFVCH